MTIVDGEPALTGGLEALRNQLGGPKLEIIVPYDDTISGIDAIAERFPEVRLVNLGSLHPENTPLNAFTQHTIYDRRRAGGLRMATGRLIAMLEDRGYAQPDWAQNVMALHNNPNYAAVGGTIENGAQGNMRWALFFCDFGRFQPPAEQDDPEYLTDINICYKREALHSVRHLWQYRYQEAQINWALRRAGLHLHLSDKARVVLKRRGISLEAVIKERIQWGRVFGQVRGRETSRTGSLLWAAVAPVLPSVLFIRHFLRQLKKRQKVFEFIRAIPATLLLLHFWALGEFIGYCEAARMPRKPETNELSHGPR